VGQRKSKHLGRLFYLIGSLFLEPEGFEETGTKYVLMGRKQPADN